MWVVLEILGPLVIDSIAAPHIQGYQIGTLILGSTHVLPQAEGEKDRNAKRTAQDVKPDCDVFLLIAPKGP